MQHYYVPTRLLDWTEVLGVAIYFAVMFHVQTPCIWLLNPLSMNERSIGRRRLIHCDDSDFSYKNLYWEKKPMVPKTPIAIEHPYRNSRILAQRGSFTIHGDDPRGADQIYPECVGKIEIPEDAISEAKEFLWFADINEFSLFPDLEGLAPFLKGITGLGY